jgi:hypothetical protein
MDGKVVYDQDSIVAKFDDKKVVLWIGLRSCPSNNAIDSMWDVVSKLLINHSKRSIIHLAHVETDNMEPPGISTLIHVVSKIVHDFDDIKKKCKRVIVQPKIIDRKVEDAVNMFFSIMGDKVKLDITADATQVQKLIDEKRDVK